MTPTPARHTHRRLCDILGTLLFQQGHALGEMARAAARGDAAEAGRVEAANEIEAACRMSTACFAALAARLDEKGAAPEVSAVLHECIDHLRDALAALDPPTTTVDGAATGAGPSEQETHP